MSKITNDGLTLSGTGCFIAVTIWQQWVSKGYVMTMSNFCVFWSPIARGWGLYGNYRIKRKNM